MRYGFEVILVDGQKAVINAFPVGDPQDALRILTQLRPDQQIGVITSGGCRRMMRMAELGLGTAEGRSVFLKVNGSG
ncbi:MAG: hypothetical protein ABIH67_05125 [Candidatus Uhrbacteria bacterium]